MSSEQFFLGIDAGGTHTDAVLCSDKAILASAKVQTKHENLPLCLKEVISSLANALTSKNLATTEIFSKIARVTLGTTLAINALLQDKADLVGLVLASGPGLSPMHFALGQHTCLITGGLDHRGLEVSPLNLSNLNNILPEWQKAGVKAIACVSKFSPRNPKQEKAMAEAIEKTQANNFAISQGHKLSGALNFPRRIATTYYNAAVQGIEQKFLDAVEAVLAEFQIQAPVRLLKADGGALSAKQARQEPVQAILSGPAASVMGLMALCPQNASYSSSLLLDIGGTTTDIAVFANGSPILSQDGMRIKNRSTLVRSLATTSIAVGGDSCLHFLDNKPKVGPLRSGNALAFAGEKATLVDALNVYALQHNLKTAGDVSASLKGLEILANEAKMSSYDLALAFIQNALEQIKTAVEELLTLINSRPVYTLAALRSQKAIQPEKAWLVGGPAKMLEQFLAETLKIPTTCAPFAEVANAVGAAMTLPTASLAVYADSRSNSLNAPALDIQESLGGKGDLETVKKRSLELLQQHLAENNPESAELNLEILEADMFAVLDDSGHSSKDMRVICQVVPQVKTLQITDKLN